MSGQSDSNFNAGSGHDSDASGPNSDASSRASHSSDDSNSSSGDEFSPPSNNNTTTNSENEDNNNNNWFIKWIVVIAICMCASTLCGSGITYKFSKDKPSGAAEASSLDAETLNKAISDGNQSQTDVLVERLTASLAKQPKASKKAATGSDISVAASTSQDNNNKLLYYLLCMLAGAGILSVPVTVFIHFASSDKIYFVAQIYWFLVAQSAICFLAWAYEAYCIKQGSQSEMDVLELLHKAHICTEKSYMVDNPFEKDENAHKMEAYFPYVCFAFGTCSWACPLVLVFTSTLGTAPVDNSLQEENDVFTNILNNQTAREDNDFMMAMDTALTNNKNLQEEMETYAWTNTNGLYTPEVQMGLKFDIVLVDNKFYSSEDVDASGDLIGTPSELTKEELPAHAHAFMPAAGGG